MIRCWVALALSCLAIIAAEEHWTDAYDLAWPTQGETSATIMPIGNGDIAANVWVDDRGDLLLLLAKADAWDRNGILMKPGRLRIHLDGISLAAPPCRQSLHLADGELHIDGTDLHLCLRVDANAPVIVIDVESAQPCTASATLEVWRTTAHPKETPLDFSDSYATFTGDAHRPVMIDPDTIMRDRPDQVRWYHHNAVHDPDPYEDLLRLQGLAGWIGHHPHPLQHRIWGGAVTAPGWTAHHDDRLRAATAQTAHHLRIHLLSQTSSSPVAWNRALDDAMAEPVDPTQQRAAHNRWWRQFWDRSWLIPTTTGRDADALQRLGRAYTLQRYLNACAGRGAYPIKFNGSLFSMGTPQDPDRRLWGPAYWFQNSRLVYWPMLADGDVDLMQPFFRMYQDMLPLLTYRTHLHFHHGGAYLSETMPFWGGQTGACYGWTPFHERTDPLATNPFIKTYWQGGLELSLMMLEAQRYQPQDDVLRTKVVPLASAVVEFYRCHYPSGPDGVVHLTSTQALETWQSATDPAPDLVGLHTVLDRLLTLDPHLTDPDQRQAWLRFKAALPHEPQGLLREHQRHVADAGVPVSNTPHRDGTPTCWQRWQAQIARNPDTTILLPAATYHTYANQENPELYAVFPYRAYGLGKPDLELARMTFAMRMHTGWHDQGWGMKCWMQDDVQAALLGETTMARQLVLTRAEDRRHRAHRFPAFYDAGPDECPDVDHGGAMALALQYMLLQCDDRRIVVRPSWPRDWDCSFRLHAPHATILEGRIHHGILHLDHVSPESRRRDIIDGAMPY